MDVPYQFVASALVGGIGELGYLITSYTFDKYVDKRVSNLIGLSVDTVLDFFLQSWVFLNPKTVKEFFDYKIMYKFIISIIIMNIIRQFMFMIVYEFRLIKEYINRGEKHKKSGQGIDHDVWNFFHDRTLLVRYVITLIFFILIEFPVRKYLVFVKK
tara:strand:+ start:287 stop:757 length:471 start_codon:yes stop_codon:yes gene_type:complete